MKVVLYNIQYLPRLVVHNGQAERYQPLLHYLRRSRADVIVLVELFEPQYLQQFAQDLADLYPYYAFLPRRTWSFTSGGIAVWSRTPLLATHHMFYKDRADSDALASKGALYVCVTGKSRGPAHYHLVATHLQSWLRYQTLRTAQLDELHTWWASLQIPTSEPALFVGDFNIDLHTQVEQLGAERYRQLPRFDRRHLPYSWVPGVNPLAGFDGTAAEFSKDAESEYFSELCWSPPNTRNSCRTYTRAPRVQGTPALNHLPRTLPDWAYVPAGSPLAASLRLGVVHNPVSEPLTFPLWRTGWLSGPRVTTTELSDHRPVCITWQAS